MSGTYTLPVSGAVTLSTTLPLIQAQRTQTTGIANPTSFSALTSGTNITAAMVIGTGSSLSFTGTGTELGINYGLTRTISCVFTGFGLTSDSATITWPTVAGITSNPLAFRNQLSLPAGTVRLPAYSFTGALTARLWLNGSCVDTSVGGADAFSVCAASIIVRNTGAKLVFTVTGDVISFACIGY